MSDPRIMEYRAVERRFAELTRRWGLTVDELRTLLAPGIDAVEREHCMRLILELDWIMAHVIERDEFRDWLRDPGPQGFSPLAFLSVGRTERSAMLAAARMRYREITGFEI